MQSRCDVTQPQAPALSQTRPPARDAKHPIRCLHPQRLRVMVDLNRPAAALLACDLCRPADEKLGRRVQRGRRAKLPAPGVPGDERKLRSFAQQVLRRDIFIELRKTENGSSIGLEDEVALERSTDGVRRAVREKTRAVQAVVLTSLQLTVLIG